MGVNRMKMETKEKVGLVLIILGINAAVSNEITQNYWALGVSIFVTGVGLLLFYIGEE